MDMEFFQFPPTALRMPGVQPFLISEAVRGEGGVLLDANGVRFMLEYDERGELAPRDIVARAILERMQRTGSDHVYLDVTHLPGALVIARFPQIYRFCLDHGLDITSQRIPVSPAAHYTMGGIRTNVWGETNIAGLYACGECACTGVHGANRLASNSLLETVIFAKRVVHRTLEAPGAATEPAADAIDLSPAVSGETAPPSREALQALMWESVGIVRSGDGLARAKAVLAAWQASLPAPTDRPSHELADLVVCVRLDSFFHVERYPSDDFSVIVEFCQEAGIPIQEYATPAFLHRFNGLMLHNADRVERVFTLVFPSDDVLAEGERRASGDPALIFTHHPMDFETSGRGLVAVGEEGLRRGRGGGGSLYSAHARLDCHEAVSTSRALARAAGVPAETTFAGYYGGHAGGYGRIEPTTFEEVCERVRRACAVERLETKAHRDRAVPAGRQVERVAVVAGGAAYPPLMQEALDAGCDTYLTGDFRVRHGGPWAEEHRPEFDAFVDQVPLNLIGGSHYATEALVLRDDMLAHFRELGLGAEFVAQADPWR